MKNTAATMSALTSDESTGNLSTRAMLIKLSIGGWEARCQDKEVERDVAAKHNITKVKAGKYSKYLINVNHPALDAIGTAENEARQEFYKWTLPWNDQGTRILDAGNWLPFTEAMRKARENYEDKVREFLPLYPSLKDEAKQERNGLYREGDYPKPEALAKRYRYDVRVLPWPDARDFRVDLADSTVAQIREQIAEDTNNALSDAVKDIYARLLKPVSKMAETLSEKDKVFRDTLVDNIDGLVKWLPKLNITGNADITAMLNRIGSELIVRPNRLRESPTVRKQTAQKAAAIASDLAAFMTPQQ